MIRPEPRPASQERPDPTAADTHAGAPEFSSGARDGLRVARRYTRPGIHPFDEVEWELRDAVISNERSEVAFEQRNVEVPKFWSQLATNVVAQKYFRGTLGTPERETSVKQLIGRVARAAGVWGARAATSPTRPRRRPSRRS